MMKGLIQCPCCNQGDINQGLKFIIESIERELGEELYSESGYRCLKHNKKVGGEDNSEHTVNPSEGIDIKCITSQLRYKLLKKLLAIDGHRIGIGKNILHFGISKTLPQNVVWHYYK